MSRYALMSSPTCVYRAFDRFGNQLYVGVAVDVKRRWMCHRSQTKWARECLFLLVHEYWCRNYALWAEINFIRATKPIHNKKRDGCWMGDGYKPRVTRGAALDGPTFWWVFRSARCTHGQG